MSALELTVLLGVDEDWRTRAACRNTNPAWFDLAKPGDFRQVLRNKRAVRLCSGCPVFNSCDALRREVRPEGVIFAGRARRVSKARAEPKRTESSARGPGRQATYACGTKQARRRHRRAGQDCRTCRIDSAGNYLREIPGCGTDAGYQAHRRAGEPRCEACRTAHRLARYERAERRQRLQMTTVDIATYSRAA